jgi:hypothetical protein
VNVLADILSRAIADNLNCNLTREHPLSKQWAAIIPPIPENFSVDNKTLYKFLTTSLQPESMDILYTTEYIENYQNLKLLMKLSNFHRQFRQKKNTLTH